MTKLKVGDVVMLKSGGPEMTVVKIGAQACKSLKRKDLRELHVIVSYMQSMC